MDKISGIQCTHWYIEYNEGYKMIFLNTDWVGLPELAGGSIAPVFLQNAIEGRFSVSCPALAWASWLAQMLLEHRVSSAYEQHFVVEAA